MQVFFIIYQKIIVQFFRFSASIQYNRRVRKPLDTNTLSYTHTRHTPRDNERFRKAAGRKISGRLAARHEK